MFVFLQGWIDITIYFGHDNRSVKIWYCDSPTFETGSWHWPEPSGSKANTKSMWRHSNPTSDPWRHYLTELSVWENKRPRDIDVLVGLSLICLTYSLGGTSTKRRSLSRNAGILGAVPPTSEGVMPRLHKCAGDIPPESDNREACSG